MKLYFLHYMPNFVSTIETLIFNYVRDTRVWTILRKINMNVIILRTLLMCYRCWQLKPVENSAEWNREIIVARIFKHNPNPNASSAHVIASVLYETVQLNDYSVSAFTKEDLNNIPEVEFYDELQPVENIYFIVNEEQEQLNKRNIHKSDGPVDLHPLILKTQQSLAVLWLRYLTNLWELESFQMVHMLQASQSF